MVNDTEEIKGHELFESQTEKTRIKDILIIVADIFPIEKIKWLVPNMQKDSVGKLIKKGLFVFLDDIVFEFRNYLTSVNFDYAKYDLIRNIRFEVDNPQSPTFAWLQFYHTSKTDFLTTITVFGKRECLFLYEIMKELSKFITS